MEIVKFLKTKGKHGLDAIEVDKVLVLLTKNSDVYFYDIENDYKLIKKLDPLINGRYICMARFFSDTAMITGSDIFLAYKVSH